MSHTLELLSTVQHGTVDGYRAGCHGSTVSCGAVVSCTDVFTRYQGDWSFRRRVDAGEQPADIVAAELAKLEEVREADKAANRKAKAESARATKEREERRLGIFEPRLVDKIAADVRRMVGDKMTVQQIADALGVSPQTVARARHALGIRGTQSAVDRDEVARLHAEGMTDTEIGRVMGFHNSTISTIRRTVLHLPAVPAPEARARSLGPRAQRAQAIRDLHAEGKTDKEMAEALGITRTAVYQARQRLGLALNRQPRPGELARVDQRPEAKAARIETITVHGTPDGYEAGCRGRGCPESPSCTDAMLEAHRAARHQGGA